MYGKALYLNLNHFLRDFIVGDLNPDVFLSRFNTLNVVLIQIRYVKIPNPLNAGQIKVPQLNSSKSNYPSLYSIGCIPTGKAWD